MCPRPARWWRSGRRRRPPLRWPRAPGCSWTRGRGSTLFALAQGFWDGPYEGAPAQPETGALVRLNGDGTFTEVIGGLDRPTSLEIIKNTAYVVTIDGEIWTIDNIAGPPFGSHP